jgi:S-formylglutathione hydrolase FrmB
MAFCTMQFHGGSIGKKSSMNLLIPEVPGPWPVLLLLHGLSDDHTAWCRRTSLERYVESRKLLVVMPDGHRNWYVNDPRNGGLAYEDHIIGDVLGLVDRTFDTVANRGGRAVAGLSMGGYGAVMLAMKHPEMFSVACGLSSAVAFAGQRPGRQRDEFADLRAALDPAEHDCYALAEALVDAPTRLAVRLDCGTEDFLLQANRDFHAHLDSIGLEHEYVESPGEHNWAYWDAHIQDTLAFLDDHLPGLQGD